MSNFGQKLEDLIKRHNLTGMEVSARSGISNSQFSLWRRGEQTSVNAADFIALAHAITQDEYEQAELLRAHLLDECQGPGAELIKIEIERDILNDSQRHLTELEHAFIFLRREIPENQPLRDLIIDLAKSLGMPKKEP